MSLSIANLDKFLANNLGKEFGVNKETLKYFPIMFLNSIFKVMSVAILCVMYRVHAISIVCSYNFVLYLFELLLTSDRLYKLSNEMDWLRQNWYCTILSWLTATNLENSRTAKIFRLTSAYFWFVFYTLTLVITAIIANKHPNTNVHYFSWSDVKIVENIGYLNAMVCVTSSIGLLSLLIDFGYFFFGLNSIYHQKRFASMYLRFSKRTL